MEVDTKVDPKTMSLDALIKKDKEAKKGQPRNNRRDRKDGVRNKMQGGRPRFNDQGVGRRPSENFRARKTGNMIQKQRDQGGRQRDNRRNRGNQKVSRLFVIVLLGKHNFT